MLHILVQQGLEQSWTLVARDALEELDRDWVTNDIDWFMNVFEDILSSCLEVSKGMCIGLFHELNHFG